MNTCTEKAVVSAKKFASKHKTKIAVIATAATCIKIHVTTVKGWNEFLEEHDLMDEYYTPTDEEMGELV